MSFFHVSLFFATSVLVAEVLSYSSLRNPPIFLSDASTKLFAVKTIESTPNPSSFKLCLDQSILSGPGQTFFNAYQAECPEAVKSILATPGMESVYAMTDWVCVNKLPSSAYSWDDLLPLCVGALGGAVAGSDAAISLNRLNTLMLQPIDASAVTDQVCITIKMQSSSGIPIQIEASDGLTTKRQALSHRFASAMEAFILKDDGKDKNHTGNKMKFFEGRSWIPRGVLYAATLDDALAAAVDDVEVVYSDDRLSMLVSGTSKEAVTTDFLDVASSNDKIALRAVEQLSSLIDSLRLAQPTDTALSTAKSALLTLTEFVASGAGSLSARRMAISYLGSCSSDHFPSYFPFKDAIFSCLSRAFTQERSARLRRTAGDALSDLGDDRAIPIAVDQLNRDPSKLVRWRAARILGELCGISVSDEGRASTCSAVAALQAATAVEGQSFEVVFECMSCLSLLTKSNDEVDKVQSISMREFLKASKAKE